MKLPLLVKHLCFCVRWTNRLGSRSRSPHDKLKVFTKHSSSVFIFQMATVLFALLTNAAYAAGDPERGARGFQACMICHSVNAGEHSTGPSLANLLSRKAGTAEGFPHYSQALKDTNVIWNENNLDKWLDDPRRFIPGTSMAMQGIKDAQERSDLIAYLKAVSENMAPAMPQQGTVASSIKRAMPPAIASSAKPVARGGLPDREKHR